MPRLEDDDSAAGAGFARLWWIAALILACAPSLGTLSAPWIAEDALILAKVDAADLGSDLAGPQLGLHLVRFWRPVVTMSWWLQAHTTGIDPLALRLFNISLHALSALLVGLVLRRFGAGPLIALLTATMAATYPFQGGTVTWIAGRTDGMVGVLFCCTLLAALWDRRVLTAVLVFVACATKEFAFVLPGWVALAVWAQKGRLAPAWRAAWPAALVSLGALVLRRLAVGSFTGGYAGGTSRVDALGILRGLQNGVLDLSPTLAPLGLLILAGALAGAWNRRVVLAGLGLSFCALLPLLPLLISGPLPPTNVRLYWVVELGLVVAAGGACLNLRALSGWRLGLPAAVFAIVLGLRGAEARLNVLEWAEAAQVGEAAIAKARLRAGQDMTDGPSTAETSAAPWQPLLWDGFPATHRGAYCLGFGLVDRFRSPFPTSARPVWPLRPLFVRAEALREPVGRPDREGFRDPFDPHSRQLGERDLPGFQVHLDGALFDPTDAESRVPIDERIPQAEVDRSPRLELSGAPAGALLELLLLTESGIESSDGGVFDGEGRAAFSLSEMCSANNGRLGAALIQTADLGATYAYLELRALNAEGNVVAAPWPLRLTWDAGLLDRLDL